ncbi:MAG: hypothetical protein B0D92_00445 [Spirochaeta sp. LUC14_002_19_P3]|nr:MAG: hypothetical protein B0D92_00445 [Spirochaeta sp. LUC14_002_19_P3]
MPKKCCWRGLILPNIPSKRFVAKMLHRNETYLLGILIVLILTISLISPKFLTARNGFQILKSYAYTGILSIGFLFVLIAGGLDISFTATATAAQYIMALILVSAPGTSPLLIILLPLLVGVALGSINALLIHKLGAPSIIVAIANLNIYYGILQLASGGQWLYDFPEWFQQLGRAFIFKFTDSGGVTVGLSVLTGVWIILAAAGFVILKHLRLGRRLYALGGNLEASRRAGMNIFGLRIFAYGFLGFSAGLAGIVHALNTQTVAPNALVGKEFDVVAAVVLGGASIFGGAGTIGGTLIGVALIAVITNALTILKVASYWHQVFIGSVVLASISITAFRTLLAKRSERTIDVR